MSQMDKVASGSNLEANYFKDVGLKKHNSFNLNFFMILNVSVMWMCSFREIAS